METVLNDSRTSMAEETKEKMSTVTHDVFVDVLRPAQEDELFQCFIKRDRTSTTSSYTLSLDRFKSCHDPDVAATAMEGKFLLVARKVRRATSTEYIISSDADDALLKESGVNVVGKLRSNILGTNFTIYESQPLHHKEAISSNHGGSVTSTEVSRGVQTRNFKVGQVDYERPGLNGLRRMRCTLRTIPSCTIDAEGFAPAVPTEISPTRIDINESLCSSGLRRCLQSKSAVSNSCATDFQRPLVLKSKAPQWHDKLQVWCLNFRGRVTVASVKNFQLVAATEPNQICSRTGDHGAIEPNKVCSKCSKVLLQFGKIGKNMFTMDYRYPFSAFQAFAICLSSFDRKFIIP